MPEYRKLAKKNKGVRAKKELRKLGKSCRREINAIRRRLNLVKSREQLQKIRFQLMELEKKCIAYDKDWVKKYHTSAIKEYIRIDKQLRKCEEDLEDLERELAKIASSPPGFERQAIEKLKDLQGRLVFLMVRCPGMVKQIQSSIEEVGAFINAKQREIERELEREMVDSLATQTQERKVELERKQFMKERQQRSTCREFFKKQDMTRFSNIKQFRTYSKILRKAKRKCKDKTLKQEINNELKDVERALQAFINSLCGKIGEEINAEIMKFSQLSDVEQISQADTLLLKIKSLRKGCKDPKKVKVFEDVEKELKNQRENACNTVGRELEIKLKNLKYERGDKDQQILFKMQQLKQLRGEAKRYEEACGKASGTYNFNMLVNQIDAAIKVLKGKPGSTFDEKGKPQNFFKDKNIITRNYTVDDNSIIFDYSQKDFFILSHSN